MKLLLTIFLSFIAIGNLTISNAQKKKGALKSEEDRLLMKLWVKDSRQQLRREK